MPVTFEHATLPNGLTIVGEIDRDAHTSACGFFVKTGARDETTDLMGVSHFLEHMMFKGTDTRTADDINREFDELGAKYNAYTSSEITCFYAQTLPEHNAPAVDLLADMMRPALRDEDFNQERNVILEEIAMYKDNPFWVLYDETIQRRYPTSPLGHRVLGTDDTIKALQRDQMRNYFTRRYSADNTVVALAGDVDFDAVTKQIEQLCGGWQTTGAARDNAEPAAIAADFAKQDDKVNRAYLLMLTPAPAMQDERRYAASLLAKALGGSDNSRLHWALVETGLADEAQASYDPHDGGGNYFVFASCSPDRAPEVGRILDAEIANLLDNTSDADLERLRNMAATGVTLAGERPSGRMQRLGRLWTMLGEHLTLEEELDRLTAVTMDDVRAVYEAFPFQPRTVGALTPA
jgi:predicted Zn-dependent peptidase